WDCRDVNNVLVPDGTYKFYVEFTDRNGQGWYTTNGLPFVKGAAPVTNTYPDLQYIKGMTVIYSPAHDLAVTAISPSIALPNTNVTVRVTVTNKTASAESFSLVLSNLTTGTRVGTQTISSLAGNSATNVAFPWSTTNLSGNYSLKATAGPITGEKNTADNSFTGVVAVQTVAHDIAVLSVSPSLATPDTSVSVQVVVTNQTSSAESFSVVLSNATTARVIGTRQVTALAGNTATTLTFPWSTTNLAGTYTLLATAGPVANESFTANNYFSASVLVRTVLRDLALAQIAVPNILVLGTTNTVSLVATNAGEQAESFTVMLSDDTDSRLIGTRQVSDLAPASTTNLSIAWPSTNSLSGYHTLRAVAVPLAGEINRLNNTNILTVPVAAQWTTNVLVKKGATWRYQDQGLDLTDTPWKQSNYYDLTWSSGPAPLGYCTDDHQTNITTVLSWGGQNTNKYPTYYFRTAFNVDTLPTALLLNVRRDDGAVLYLNGAEMTRLNMATGAVSYATLASAVVSGANEYLYAPANAPGTNLCLGRNVLAAEVHQRSPSSSDIVLDLELLGITPVFPAKHDVDAIALSTEGDALYGDNLPVSVTLTNGGNVTETVLVLLKNLTTGQIIGSQTVTGLLPAGAATVHFGWQTLNAASGANQLAAYTVVGGVTNFAGSFTNAAVVNKSVFATNLVNASGSIGGRCASVVASGNLLVVGAGATLQVWDRPNASAPVQTGSVRLPGMIQDITVAGSYAFVACGKDGVQFVDLTDPRKPAYRLTFQTSGHAYASVASGNYLYVADGRAGVRVVNIANPATPALVGVYYTEGPARAIAVSGNSAYVLDQHQGLLVLNVSNPGAPSLVGAYQGFDAG
ncbi:MAG TPA: CARDB domain-containing protein, partial [Clostridia bacterium]|nr:CARDB domain-containing protein [Clostridia bacterium]